ncbi:hypothetical protein ACFFRR_002886 [Megaselia abdita]
MKVTGCCCFDLRTGTKTIAYLHIVFSVINLITNFFVFITPNSESRSSAGVGILGSIISLAACYFLLKGIKENQPDYFKYWIILNGIGLGLILIVMIIIAVVLLTYSPQETDEYTAETLIVAAILLLISEMVGVYFWLVVRSYKSQLAGDVNVV